MCQVWGLCMVMEIVLCQDWGSVYGYGYRLVPGLDFVYGYALGFKFFFFQSLTYVDVCMYFTSSIGIA